MVADTKAQRRTLLEVTEWHAQFNVISSAVSSNLAWPALWRMTGEPCPSAFPSSRTLPGLGAMPLCLPLLPDAPRSRRQLRQASSPHTNWPASVEAAVPTQPSTSLPPSPPPPPHASRRAPLTPAPTPSDPPPPRLLHPVLGCPASVTSQPLRARGSRHTARSQGGKQRTIICSAAFRDKHHHNEMEGTSSKTKCSTLKGVERNKKALLSASL